MAGVEVFTRIASGKETVKGTPVAPARRLYMVAYGNFDIGDQWNFGETENRSIRTRVSRAPIQVRGAPTLKLKDIDGIGYDDFAELLSTGQRGGQAGAGGGADKTWTFTTQNGAANSPESLSIDVGDDVQNWRLQYCMPTRWMIAAPFGGKTTFEMDLFAQQAIKTAAASPAENTTPRIPSDLWTVKFAATFAGLGAASVQPNFLRSWSLEYLTGFVPRFYQDGTLFLGQHVETDIVGNFSMEVESTALAVSEFVDKYRAGTLDFIRLKATGAALGASNYSLQFDAPIYWDQPKPLAAVDAGVNLYQVSGRLAYDLTATKSLETTLVCSLAAIP